MAAALNHHDSAGPPIDADHVLIAVDLGGTQIRTAVFDFTGAMLSRRSVPTPKLAGQDRVIATVIDQIRRSATECGRPLAVVGVSALGPVDPATGMIRTAPTLHDFTDVPIGARLRSALEVPVHVYNDGNAAAVAEWRLGAGRGAQNFCYVTVSTGIGCGIISNGRLVTGHSGHAGEFGRVRIPTADGGTVRLEEISSGTAIAATARTMLAGGADTSLRDVTDPAAVTAADVAAAAYHGDPVAKSIFTTAGETLGVQLANLARTIDPETIAIGGGVALAGDAFWSPVRAAVATSLAHDDFPVPRILAAGLQGDVGLHGAALAVLDLHKIATSETGSSPSRIEPSA